MRKTIYFIAMALLTMACMEKKNQVKNTVTKKIKSGTLLTSKANHEVETDADCVFDNYYKKITTEWLNKIFMTGSLIRCNKTC